MLPTRKLRTNDVVTSAIGFGCAGLFSIPQRRGRLAVLEAMYDVGIRHFDVAPMYGLGLAEAELASFLKHRRGNVTITTKFGIDPTLLAKGIAPFQRPLRTFLERRPNVREGLIDSGRGPHSGLFGRLLYTSAGYHCRSAQLGIEQSLHTLKTDYIDIFLLHDPMSDLINDAPELADYLDKQCLIGKIRCWGVTGRNFELSGITKRLGRAPVLQFRDDIFEVPLNATPLTGGASITYGSLARSLPILRRFLADSPDASDMWSERLGVDLTEESSLPRVLLSIALRRNTGGPVLFTTTKPQRGRVAAEAAIQSDGLSDVEMAKFGEFADAARLACREVVRTP
jgi:D-threo-aldose 1-dehydrogenase